MDSIFRPNLAFLNQYPSAPREEVQALFASRHLMVCGSWQTAWQNVAAFCLELKACADRHGVPELFERCLPQVGPGAGELKEMMRAKTYLDDPRWRGIIGDKISPKQICGAVDAFQADQMRLDTEGVTSYDIKTEVQDLSFDTVSGSDVLPVHPTLAGESGEKTIEAILTMLGLPFVRQYSRAWPCDFGEMKRPDYKVGTVKAAGDASLANGFYIESTQRMTAKDKDLGLFYLLHQIVKYSDLPVIVVYDGPMVSDRVWNWAQSFRKEHAKTNRLFAVATLQQFREWALRKIGRQA